MTRDELQEMMAVFLKKSKGDGVVIKRLPHNLSMCNQKPITSDPYGKRKLELGLETVTIYELQPNRKRQIYARLTQTDPDTIVFEDTDVETLLRILNSGT